MTRQTNGWAARAIHNQYAARQARNKLIAKLRAERVNGDEFTPAELLARMRDLKADYLARQNTKETPE